MRATTQAQQSGSRDARGVQPKRDDRVCYLPEKRDSPAQGMHQRPRLLQKKPPPPSNSTTSNTISRVDIRPTIGRAKPMRYWVFPPQGLTAGLFVFPALGTSPTGGRH